MNLKDDGKVSHIDVNELDKLLIQTPYIYNRYSYSSFEGNLENKLHLDLLLKVTDSENINENTKQINELYKILIKIEINFFTTYRFYKTHKNSFYIICETIS